SGTFAKREGRVAILAAETLKNDLVLIFQEIALLSPRQINRVLAPLVHFQQRAFLTFARTGQGASAQQITGLQIATVDAVVGNELGHGPIGLLEVAARE